MNTIIKAAPEHAQVLSEIGATTFIDAHKDSAPAWEIDRYVDAKYNVATIANELSDPRNIYHVILHDNVIAGFSKIMLSRRHPDVAVANTTKMDQIYLLKNFYGLKLGAQLLQHNIAYSKGLEQGGMWLVVWEGNQQAISFYQKFGFIIAADGIFNLTDTHNNRCLVMALSYQPDLPGAEE